MPLFGSAIEYQNTNLERAVERSTVTCLIIRYHASVLRIQLIDYHSKSPDCLPKKKIFGDHSVVNKSKVKYNFTVTDFNQSLETNEVEL